MLAVLNKSSLQGANLYATHAACCGPSIGKPADGGSLVRYLVHTKPWQEAIALANPIGLLSKEVPMRIERASLRKAH